MKSTEIAVNHETLRLAYEESMQVESRLAGRMDAIDRKLTAVFGLSSALLTIVPAIVLPSFLAENGIAQAAWIGAALCWMLSALFTYLGFRPKDFTVQPNPEVLTRPNWAPLNPSEFCRHRLFYLGEAYTKNMKLLNEKGEFLDVALGFAMAEVALVALAVVL